MSERQRYKFSDIDDWQGPVEQAPAPTTQQFLGGLRQMQASGMTPARSHVSAPASRLDAGQRVGNITVPPANDIEETPMSRLKDLAAFGMETFTPTPAGVTGAAASWFPKGLATKLGKVRTAAKASAMEAAIANGMNKEQAAKSVDSVVATATRNYIRSLGKSPEETQKLIDGYKTIALPTYKGINFEDRKPILSVLAPDNIGTSTTSKDPKARGVRLAAWSEKRMDTAYDAGIERLGESDGNWGDARWLYHVTNGDPYAAVVYTRLQGSFSPGQKTDANALNAVEAFLRSMAGESPTSIMKRLTYGHPRPSTVDDNFERAIRLGRIFQNKTEALAAAELGVHDNIPIDMWLLRALGVQSDVTPSDGLYRLVSEAVAKAAAKKNESPFEYMAKVWMGMQRIAGKPTPSFQEAIANLDLPGHLMGIASPADLPRAAQNMIAARAAARTGAHHKATSPIATSPAMPYEEFLERAQALVRSSSDTDVLGKVKPKKKRDITLDLARREARDQQLGDQFMFGEPGGRAVMAAMPVEAAPGYRSGVDPSFRSLTAEAQDKVSNKRLNVFENDEGHNVIAEGLFPGRTAPVLRGRGDWPNPSGVVENNVMATTPVQVRMQGGQIHPEDELALQFGHNLQSGMLGQDDVVHSALAYVKNGKFDAVRVFPRAKKYTISDDAFKQLRSQLPPGDWALQHRSNGIDIIKLSGPITPAEQQTVSRFAEETIPLPPNKLRAEVSGSQVMQNVASDNYRSLPWGKVGSGEVTEVVTRDIGRLTPAQQKFLDGPEMRATARDLLKKGGKSGWSGRPDHANFLRIIAESGVSGLQRALKDGQELLPVLVALGLGPLLGSRLRSGQDEPSRDSRSRERGPA